MRLRRFSPLVFAITQACQFRDLGGPADPVAGVGITLGFPGYVSDAFLTVGDQDTIRAQAYTGVWPSNTKYDSSNEPRRFTYSSSKPSVASVNLDGVIAALSPGTTILQASADGVVSPPLALAVAPPASVLRAEPDSIATHLGQTFAISVVAADEKGQSVPGVLFNVGVDTTYWAVTSIPVEGTWKLATPAVLHLTAKLVGRVRITATTLNERSRARLAASVPIVVSAP
jgi:uncharacterized protein YjdB